MAKEEQLTIDGFILKLYSEVVSGFRSPQSAETLIRERVMAMTQSERDAFKQEARTKGMHMMRCAESFLSTLTVIGAGQ